MEWSEVEVFKLINLFKQFPCLWDFQSTSYKRLDLKKHAWDEIAKNMSKGVENVKKKMKNLRSAYLVEKKKVNFSKKSGSSTEDLYTPHLYYYSEMNFLDRAICLRQTTSNLAMEDSELLEFTPITEYSQESSDIQIFDGNDSQVAYASYTPIKETPAPLERKSSCSKKRKSERDEKINIALDAIISKTNEENEDIMFSYFGKSIGLQLAKMPLNRAMETMAEVQKLLTAAVNKTDILEASVLAADI